VLIGTKTSHEPKFRPIWWSKSVSKLTSWSDANETASGEEGRAVNDLVRKEFQSEISGNEVYYTAWSDS